MGLLFLIYNTAININFPVIVSDTVVTSFVCSIHSKIVFFIYFSENATV